MDGCILVKFLKLTTMKRTKSKKSSAPIRGVGQQFRKVANKQDAPHNHASHAYAHKACVSSGVRSGETSYLLGGAGGKQAKKIKKSEF